MEQWIVIREEWPKNTGKPIAYMLCRYSMEHGVWYNVQSEGTYSAEEFAEFEKCKKPEVKE